MNADGMLMPPLIHAWFQMAHQCVAARNNSSRSAKSSADNASSRRVENASQVKDASIDPCTIACRRAAVSYGGAPWAAR